MKRYIAKYCAVEAIESSTCKLSEVDVQTSRTNCVHGDMGHEVECLDRVKENSDCTDHAHKNSDHGILEGFGSGAPKGDAL